MALKQLKDIKLDSKLKGTIPSGFKSDDSKVSTELIIAEPLIKHPEINGLYRAFDPKTGWKTWVEYVEPAVEPEPVPEPTPLGDDDKYQIKLELLRRKIELIEKGVVTEQEANIGTLKSEIKTLATNLNII